MASARRTVVTGMGVNTPLGDSLDGFHAALVAGTSAISRWRFFDRPDVYSKVGGDLSDYDAASKLAALGERLPDDAARRLRKLCKKAPFSTGLSMLCAADAWLDSGLAQLDTAPERRGVILCGHNLGERYLLDNHLTFQDEPDWIDGLAALLTLDTDHAASIGEMLNCRGPAYTVGAACASGNVGLRAGIDEIRHHDLDVVVLAGSILDFSAMGLHAMGLLGAISIESFNDEPTKASRPYDMRREGFVPSHGTATLILEELEHAQRRGAQIYAEVLGCEATSDGSHLPTPSEDGQARTIESLLRKCNVAPDEVDFVCAHATSTMMGDISELGALKRAFGAHAEKLKINAPKSMLGHTCWSAPLVESVAALMQMKHGRLHPSINVDELDPRVDLDVCANVAVDHQPHTILKNSFGFGGLNCCALYRRFDA